MLLGSGLVALLMTLMHPYVGLVLVLAAFPFLVGVSPTVGPHEQLFFGLIVGWDLGWVMLTCTRRQSLVRLPSAVALPALLIAVLLVVSTVVGVVRGAPLLDVLRDLSQFVGYLVILPVCMVVTHRGQASKLCAALLAIGVPCYVWNTAYWVAVKHGLGWPGWPTLIVGAAYIGPFVGALLPLVLLRTKPGVRLLACFAILGLVVLSVASGYRSRVLQVVALALVGFLVTWYVDRRRRPQVLCRGLLLLTVVVGLVGGALVGIIRLPLIENPEQFYATLTDPRRLTTDLSLEGRLVEARAALNTFSQYPLLGVGLGRRVGMQWEHGRWYETAFTQHIWVTEMLMKFGILGSLLFLWFFLSVVRYALRTAAETPSSLGKALALGVAVWVVVTLIPTVGHFGDRGFNFALAIMLGVLPYLREPGLQEVGTVPIGKRGEANG